MVGVMVVSLASGSRVQDWAAVVMMGWAAVAGLG